MTLSFRVSDLYLIKKDSLATFLLYTGMFFAFLASMSPWFLWSLGSYYPLVASVFLIVALALSRTMGTPIFNRSDVLLPMAAFLLFSLYECFSTGRNINGYIMIVFKAVIFYSLFRLDLHKLQSLSTFIAKAMGVLLAASLAGHFLYLLGFSWSGRDVQLGEFYSFTNYYLFLLDDRNLFTIVPRFNSYFPEPSHVGSAAAFLLFAQRGRWKKWYNIVLMATVFFSFSLASYVYLTAIIFLNLWIKKKKMIRKLLLTVSILAAGVVASFYYNNGDNLVNNLILLRMEVDDGKLAGDNRVTGNFEKDYDNYLSSSDIFFGRSYDSTLEFGNSGFKVFFYSNGLFGIILVIAFYIISLRNAANKRAAVSAFVVAGLYFIVSAYMLYAKIFIPLYAGAYCGGEGIPNDNAIKEATNDNTIKT